MKINYFEDTDTALIHFTEKKVVETREVTENVYLDLDEQGNHVSMTWNTPERRQTLKIFHSREIEESRLLNPLHFFKVDFLGGSGLPHRHSGYLCNHK